MGKPNGANGGSTKGERFSLNLDELSDEVLMAYGDGALSPTERAQVEARLANDLEAQERLGAFVRTGNVLAQVFDQPMHEPVPRELMDVLSAARSDAIRPPSSTGHSLRRVPDEADNRSSFFGFGKLLRLAASSNWRAVAGVASAAALIVLAYQFHLEKDVSPEDNRAVVLKDLPLERPAASTPFNIFLASATQQGSHSWRDGDGAVVQGKIVLTFVDRAGAYCRHYELSGALVQTVSGVACRQNKGGWQVLAEHPVASHIKVSPSVSQGKGELRSIDDIVDEMIDGQAIELEDEAALIQSNWRRRR